MMCLIMFLLIWRVGANLARIYREYHERDVYLTEQAENGVKDVTVPMLRPILRQNIVTVIIRTLRQVRNTG